VESPGYALQTWEKTDGFCKFNTPELPIDFQWLRVPDPSDLFSLKDRPGRLRIYGREALGSWYKSALVARRQQDFSFTVTTKVAFSPDSFQQMAGLVCYYNSHKFHYLYISTDKEVGKHIIS